MEAIEEFEIYRKIIFLMVNLTSNLNNTLMIQVKQRYK